jgi:hypothetical protein
MDWDRLKRLVAETPQDAALPQKASDVFLGVAITGVATLLPIWTSEDTPTWVKGVFVAGTVFAFALYLVFKQIQRADSSNVEEHLKSLSSDMAEIEATFKPN